MVRHRNSVEVLAHCHRPSPWIRSCATGATLRPPVVRTCPGCRPRPTDITHGESCGAVLVRLWPLPTSPGCRSRLSPRSMPPPFAHNLTFWRHRYPSPFDHDPLRAEASDPPQHHVRPFAEPTGLAGEPSHSNPTLLGTAVPRTTNHATPPPGDGHDGNTTQLRTKFSNALKSSGSASSGKWTRQ
jgi:hypothetical protein